ncbi:MAG: Hpt domain-containing protein, partial [Pseudobdellovibrio sp.]
MDEFEIEIKKDYLNEAYLNLEEVEVSFMELETSSDPAPLLDKIFRMAHNLKGVSAAVGFNQVAELTHQLESLVLKIQKGQIALSSALISTLLATNDKLVEMHKAYQLNVAAVFDNTDIMEQLNSWLTGKKTEVTNETSTPDVQPETESPVAPERPAAKSSGAPVKDEDEVVRVNMSKINLLNDFVGELIVLQSVVEQQNSSVSGVQQQALFRQMIKISKEIQSLSMGLRMIPVKPLVQKLQRVVRDASKALGKDVILEVQGEHLEIDKSVLDKLADPLIHILRNGVDHGLEDPIDRIG